MSNTNMQALNEALDLFDNASRLADGLGDSHENYGAAIKLISERRQRIRDLFKRQQEELVFLRSQKEELLEMAKLAASRIGPPKKTRLLK